MSTNGTMLGGGGTGGPVDGGDVPKLVLKDFLELFPPPQSGRIVDGFQPGFDAHEAFDLPRGSVLHFHRQVSPNIPLSFLDPWGGPSADHTVKVTLPLEFPGKFRILPFDPVSGDQAVDHVYRTVEDVTEAFPVYVQANASFYSTPDDIDQDDQECLIRTGDGIKLIRLIHKGGEKLLECRLLGEARVRLLPMVAVGDFTVLPDNNEYLLSDLMSMLPRRRRIEVADSTSKIHKIPGLPNNFSGDLFMEEPEAFVEASPMDDPGLIIGLPNNLNVTVSPEENAYQRGQPLNTFATNNRNLFPVVVRVTDWDEETTILENHYVKPGVELVIHGWTRQSKVLAEVGNKYYALPLTYQGLFKLKGHLFESVSELENAHPAYAVRVVEGDPKIPINKGDVLRIKREDSMMKLKGEIKYLKCERLEPNGRSKDIKLPMSSNAKFEELIEGIKSKNEYGIRELEGYVAEQELFVELIRPSGDQKFGERDLPLSMPIVLCDSVVEPAVYVSVETAEAPAFHIPLRTLVYVTYVQQLDKSCSPLLMKQSPRLSTLDRCVEILPADVFKSLQTRSRGGDDSSSVAASITQNTHPSWSPIPSTTGLSVHQGMHPSVVQQQAAQQILRQQQQQQQQQEEALPPPPATMVQQGQVITHQVNYQTQEVSAAPPAADSPPTPPPPPAQTSPQSPPTPPPPPQVQDSSLEHVQLQVVNGQVVNQTPPSSVQPIPVVVQQTSVQQTSVQPHQPQVVVEQPPSPELQRVQPLTIEVQAEVQHLQKVPQLEEQPVQQDYVVVEPTKPEDLVDINVTDLNGQKPSMKVVRGPAQVVSQADVVVESPQAIGVEAPQTQSVQQQSAQVVQQNGIVQVSHEVTVQQENAQPYYVQQQNVRNVQETTVHTQAAVQAPGVNTNGQQYQSQSLPRPIQTHLAYETQPQPQPQPPQVQSQTLPKQQQQQLQPHTVQPQHVQPHTVQAHVQQQPAPQEIVVQSVPQISDASETEKLAVQQLDITASLQHLPPPMQADLVQRGVVNSNDSRLSVYSSSSNSRKQSFTSTDYTKPKGFAARLRSKFSRRHKSTENLHKVSNPDFKMSLPRQNSNHDHLMRYNSVEAGPPARSGSMSNINNTVDTTPSPSTNTQAPYLAPLSLPPSGGNISTQSNQQEIVQATPTQNQATPPPPQATPPPPQATPPPPQPSPQVNGNTVATPPLVQPGSPQPEYAVTSTAATTPGTPATVAPVLPPVYPAAPTVNPTYVMMPTPQGQQTIQSPPGYMLVSMVQPTSPQVQGQPQTLPDLQPAQVQTSQAPVQTPQSEVQISQAQVQSSQPQVQTSHPQIQPVQTQVQTSQPPVQPPQAQVQASQAEVQTIQPPVHSSQPQVQPVQTQVHTSPPQIQTSPAQVQSTRPQVQTSHTQSSQAHSAQIQSTSIPSQSSQSMMTQSTPSFTSQSMQSLHHPPNQSMHQSTQSLHQVLPGYQVAHSQGTAQVYSAGSQAYNPAHPPPGGQYIQQHGYHPQYLPATNGRKYSVSSMDDDEDSVDFSEGTLKRSQNFKVVIPPDGNLYHFSVKKLADVFRQLRVSDEAIQKCIKSKLDGKKFSRLKEHELDRLGLLHPVVIHFRRNTKKAPNFML